MVPKSIRLSGQVVPLLDTWQDVYELYDIEYRRARRKDRRAKRHAAALTAGASSPLEEMRALHAFLRDEVTTLPTFAIGLEEGETADGVLEARRGTPAGKAILLQAMLAARKTDARLVWAADRENGIIDLEVANPWWFDRVLVRVELDGEPMLLDPSDPSVAAGRVAPYFEGTQALLLGKGEPEIIELAVSPHEENSSRARVDLRLDEEGRITGGGSLELSGHQAWRVLGLEDGVAYWQERLADGFSGYDVGEVDLKEDLSAQRVRVDWSLRQPEQEVLGDEATIYPSRPMGPIRQFFALPPRLRKTPVLLPFGLLDEVVTTVRWPTGWRLENRPQVIAHHGAAGTVELELDLDLDVAVDCSTTGMKSVNAP